MLQIDTLYMDIDGHREEERERERASELTI